MEVKLHICAVPRPLSPLRFNLATHCRLKPLLYLSESSGSSSSDVARMAFVHFPPQLVSKSLQALDALELARLECCSRVFRTTADFAQGVGCCDQAAHDAVSQALPAADLVLTSGESWKMVRPLADN